MTNTTNGVEKLNQSMNKVNISGEVVEKEFEVKEFTKRGTGDKYNAAVGSFSIRVKENEVHQVRFFKPEFTNAGALSKGFTGVQTAFDRYISVADIAKVAEKDEAAANEMSPTKVNIQANINLNEFYNDAEELKSRPQLNIDFISEVKPNELYTPKATFDLDIVVAGMSPEVEGEDNEETGRTKLNGLVVQYNGSVFPMKLVVTAGGKDYIESNFENWSTATVKGEIVDFRKVTIKQEEMGFGEARTVESYEFVQEYYVTGASLIDSDSAKAFDVGLVKVALTERERFLETKLAESKNKQSNAGADQNRNTFGTGTPVSKPQGQSQAEKAGVDISNLF